MKHLFTTLLLLIISLTSHAVVITCSSETAGAPRNSWEEEPTDVNSHIGIVQKVTGTCSVLNLNVNDQNFGKLEEDLKFEIKGYGLGLSFVAGEAMIFNCPTLKRNNITKFPFVGLKAEATAFILGADVGIFSNKRLGACLLTGIKAFGVGAGIAGTKLKFTDASLE